MIYCQAKKFVDKSVYVVEKDIVVVSGILKQVELKTGAGTVLTNEGKTVQVPIEKLYPNK